MGLDELPDGVAVRPNDHAAFNRGVVRQSGAQDDVVVPLRVVLGSGGDLLLVALAFACHGETPVNVCLGVLLGFCRVLSAE